MPSLPRILASTVLAAGIAVGFEGCPGDGWQLDPPMRVEYEGPHTDAVVQCAELTWTHGIEYSSLMVRAKSDRISVGRRHPDSPRLLITGRTVHEFASYPDVVTTWGCEVNPSDSAYYRLVSEHLVSGGGDLRRTR